MENEARFVAAVVVIVIRGGRVLAMRRSSHRTAGAGLWEALSGRVLPDEDPRTAALRETLEESGLEVRLDPRPVTAYTARRAGEPMLVVVYRAFSDEGEVRRSREHDAHAWLTPEELAGRSSPTALVEAARLSMGTRNGDMHRISRE